jgi:hypothetical protein
VGQLALRSVPHRQVNHLAETAGVTS